MRITEYKLLVEPALEMTAKVNELIKKGWQPFGSPSVLPPTPDLLEAVDTVFQAMIRQEPE
ncbi:MAG: DUF1737 domain-containing protein [Verrucomicrobiota bacterium]